MFAQAWRRSWIGVLTMSFAVAAAAGLAGQASADPTTLNIAIDKHTVYQGSDIGITGNGAGLLPSAVADGVVVARLGNANGPIVGVDPVSSSIGQYARVNTHPNGGSASFVGNVRHFRTATDVRTGRHTLHVSTYPRGADPATATPIVTGTVSFNYVATPVPGVQVFVTPAAPKVGDQVTVTFEHYEPGSSRKVVLRRGGPSGAVVLDVGIVHSRYFSTVKQEFSIPADIAAGKYWVGYDDNGKTVGKHIVIGSEGANRPALPWFGS